MNNNCNDCDILYQFCKLVDDIIKDIQYLEAETVSYRYALSRYLPDYEKKSLRDEILSNLTGRYSCSEAYQQYMELFYNKQDPMDSDAYVEHLIRLAHGQD